MANATCTVDGCDKKAQARGLCPMHYQRWRTRGDVGIAGYERTPNVGNCSVEGCEQPQRKLTWCASHYAQIYRQSHELPRPEPKPFIYKWSGEPNCIVCGKPNGSFRSRKFCSAVCQMLVSRHGGIPPNPHCVRCGVEIDLLTAGKNGRRKKSDTKLCRKCKTMHRRHWASPGELALRDGSYCQLCGCDVDLLAVFPDPMRASVDHIIPRAWGGADDRENFQLSHLHCNHVKSDRYGGRSWRSTA